MSRTYDKTDRRISAVVIFCDMIRELVHDPIFLCQKSETATEADLQTALDLYETLSAHRECCVGMAANMIGVAKSIICFDNNGTYMTMFNPQIIKCSEPYETEESCLSLLGGARKTKRYKKIRVQYHTSEFKVRTKIFEGFTAQIIQHEIDHCNGVLI